MNLYWCRFYMLATEAPHFEYHGPWWESGFTCTEPEALVICAVVCAESEEAARKVIEDCFDAGHGLVWWSFTNQRADDWDPFTDRFPRADWMRWPLPVGTVK